MKLRDAGFLGCGIVIGVLVSWVLGLIQPTSGTAGAVGQWVAGLATAGGVFWTAQQTRADERRRQARSADQLRRWARDNPSIDVAFIGLEALKSFSGTALSDEFPNLRRASEIVADHVRGHQPGSTVLLEREVGVRGPADTFKASTPTYIKLDAAFRAIRHSALAGSDLSPYVLARLESAIVDRDDTRGS